MVPCRYRYKFLIFCFWSLLHLAAAGQRFSVRSYNVEDGLIQSQAVALAEDSSHHLWIATLGGVSRFDSKTFTNYTTTEGLLSNYCTALLIDSHQKIWIGSQRGLSYFDGKQFRNFRLSNLYGTSRMTSLVETGEGFIWGLYGWRLLRINAQGVDSVSLPYNQATPACLGKDAEGNLLAVINGKGLFRFSNGKWVLLDNGQRSGFAGTVAAQIYTSAAGRVWLLSNRGLFQYNSATGISLYHGKNGKGLPIHILSMYEENENDLWIGTFNGICRVQKNSISFLGLNNGFTNQPILAIMKDKEAGIWFGSNSGGIQRFADEHLKFYDQPPGMAYSPGMGFARDNKMRLWTGTYGGGMIYMEGKNLVSKPIPSAIKSAQLINFSIGDEKGRVWVGTNGGGLWRVDDGRFINISERYRLPDPLYYCGTVAPDGSLYFGSPQHVYRFQNEKMESIPAISGFITSLNADKKDTLLIGTSQGAYIYAGKKFAPYPSNLDILAKASVGAIVVSGKSIFFGTADNGLFIDPDGTGTRITHVSTTDGLSSNNIYSMVTDNSGDLWLATGYYINRLTFKNNSTINHIRLYGKSEGINSAEGNQNSAFRDVDGTIWIGTTKGTYHIYPQTIEHAPPVIPVFLKNVLLFSQPVSNRTYYDSTTGYYPVPFNLKLPYYQNHLTFEFQGVSFSGPDAVRYQYYLEGRENGFSIPSTAPFVVYSAVPPGTYTFKVRAIGADGLARGNTVSFPFEITAPFYATTVFRLMIVLLLVLSGVLIQRWRSRARLQKQSMIEKLRREEQYKVRKKTAEDFHDEMGNKLTRISILTDIAGSKLENNKEVLKLINQIRDNATTLYKGTNDIIWSLYPESDQLFEVLLRIRDFGIDLFQETEIDFVFDYPEETLRSVKLPIDYSRNIMMICKEALNNILKHAEATAVSVQVSMNQERCLQINISDNGNGFDIALIQNGHGIDNMQIRARRIQAELTILSEENKGTSMKLNLKIPL